MNKLKDAIKSNSKDETLNQKAKENSNMMTLNQKLKNRKFNKKLKKDLKGQKYPFIIHADPCEDGRLPYPNHTRGLNDIWWPEFLMDPICLGPRTSARLINASYDYFQKHEHELDFILDGETIEVSITTLMPVWTGSSCTICYRKVPNDFIAVQEAFHPSLAGIEDELVAVQIWIKGNDFELMDEYYKNRSKFTPYVQLVADTLKKGRVFNNATCSLLCRHQPEYDADVFFHHYPMDEGESAQSKFMALCDDCLKKHLDSSADPVTFDCLPVTHERFLSVILSSKEVNIVDLDEMRKEKGSIN